MYTRSFTLHFNTKRGRGELKDVLPFTLHNFAGFRPHPSVKITKTDRGIAFQPTCQAFSQKEQQRVQFSSSSSGKKKNNLRPVNTPVQINTSWVTKEVSERKLTGQKAVRQMSRSQTNNERESLSVCASVISLSIYSQHCLDMLKLGFLLLWMLKLSYIVYSDKIVFDDFILFSCGDLWDCLLFNQFDSQLQMP